MMKIGCKSFTFLGMDGNHLTFSETIERDAIVVSIQQNDEKGRVATVRIDGATFDEITRLDSSFDGLQCQSLEEIKEARRKSYQDSLAKDNAEDTSQSAIADTAQ